MEITNLNYDAAKPKAEYLIITLDIEYKKKIFKISLFDIGKEEIKILAKEKNDEISGVNYGIILKFEELKNLHKYFRMFDTFEEAKSYLIALSKVDSVEIDEIKENELILIFDLKTIKNDKMMISLNKIINDEKEEISLLMKYYNQQNKEIQELRSIIANLNERIKILENHSQKKQENQKSYNIIYSNIIKKFEEFKFLSDAICKTCQLSFQYLYSSEIDWENKEKFKLAYLGKNDIIVLVQTKKGKRFGGYAHEAFQNDEDFIKRDEKAFLFNLDKMKIYKSKGYFHSIWNFGGDSMDFGYGVDLKIYHEFLHKNNYTNQATTDYDYDEDYALNGEKYFGIEYLELYKVIFNLDSAILKFWIFLTDWA